MHTTDLHKELQILKLDDNFEHSVLQMVYMQRQNLLPLIFDNYFIQRSHIHNRQTRYVHNIDIPRVKSKHGTNTLRYKGAQLYNKLPDVLKEASSLSSFKKKLRKHYLEL